MNQLDKAQKEMEKLGQQLKEDAKKIGSTVQQKLSSGNMVSHRTIDYSYPSLIYHLRSVHVVALVLQAIVLYLWSRELGLFGFLMPFAFICLNCYLVAKRFYYSIDGRYDFHQLLSVNNNQLRLHYAIALFGSFILALLGHFTGPTLPGGLTTLLYNLSNYLSISCAFCIMGVDCFEGYKNKVL